MSTLTNKVALVLGGSRGIGAATATAFAAEGARVAITAAHTVDRAEALAQEIIAAGGQAIALKADATEPGATAAAVQSVVERFGGLDIVFASAGLFDVGAVTELTDARYDKSFDTHVRSVLEAVRAATPVMREGGRIIAVGSVFGEEAPVEGLALYTASKAAVHGLVRSWARELGPRGITANTIQPGPIDTEMNPSGEVNPMADFMRSRTALGRYGTAQEIAATAAFLAGPSASFITGQAINVDGGWTA